MILDQYGRRIAHQPALRLVRAKYDAAQTTDQNRRHWANADALSADAAHSPDVRRILRMRARYEVANNTYAKGIVLTVANDTIGTGPRLQVRAPDPDVNSFIEAEFARWAEAVDLAAKLRTMRMAKATDGEVFGLLIADLGLRTAVKLDLALVEADQVATPASVLLKDATAVDGIEFDDAGKPSAYHLLKGHPGGLIGLFARSTTGYTRVAASGVVHWFRADRPGQHRGVPELTAALPLFAQLRRYTLATLDAAETAANLAVIMETTSPPEETPTLDPALTLDLDRNTAVFAPEGWTATQMRAEQPATAYSEFKKEILNEIGRCLNVPYNIAACNSSGYNYASGRLDHQTYYKSLRIERQNIEEVVLNPLLAAWLREAQMVYRAAASIQRHVPHEWFWDAWEHVDPLKEENAAKVRLDSRLSTLAIEYAKRGLDWEPALGQWGRELAQQVAVLVGLGVDKLTAVQLLLTGKVASAAGGGGAESGAGPEGQETESEEVENAFADAARR